MSSRTTTADNKEGDKKTADRGGIGVAGGRTSRALLGLTSHAPDTKFIGAPNRSAPGQAGSGPNRGKAGIPPSSYGRASRIDRLSEMATRPPSPPPHTHTDTQHRKRYWPSHPPRPSATGATSANRSRSRHDYPTSRLTRLAQMPCCPEMCKQSPQLHDNKAGSYPAILYKLA